MMKRVLTRLNAWCTWASGVILLVILAVVLYEVLARSLLKRADTWSFELTSYALLFVVFLAAAQTLEQGGHGRVDLLTAFLSPRAKLLAEVVVQMLSLLFIALLLWATFRETLKSFQSGLVSPSRHAIPLIYVYWIMPAGTALLLLAVLVKLCAAISRWRNS
jgi:C4-dicarboxylate transporter DctQ subunit